jgi:hypothetical protein
MDALIYLLPVALLALACWAVAKGPTWLRLFAVVGAVGFCTYFGLLMGKGLQKGRFLSGHIHWLREYSAHLRRLADAGRCDTLSNTIVRFDTRFQADPQDETALQDVMYQILELGPYYRPETK